jgi:hypothetical protein
MTVQGKSRCLIIAQADHHMKRKSELPVRIEENRLPEVMEAKDFTAEADRLRPSRCGALFGDDCCEVPRIAAGDGKTDRASRVDAEGMSGWKA